MRIIRTGTDHRYRAVKNNLATAVLVVKKRKPDNLEPHFETFFNDERHCRGAYRAPKLLPLCHTAVGRAPDTEDPFAGSCVSLL